MLDTERISATHAYSFFDLNYYLNILVLIT